MVFTEVQPVRAAPPTTGLVASAPVVNDGARWEQGFAWRPERCFSVQGYGPCGTPDGVPPDVDPGVQYYQPPGFRVRDWCTTLNGELDTERVRRQADAATSFVVARELWDGALSTADPGTVDGSPYVNPYLADGTATEITAPADLATALAVLEQEAMEAAYGQTVWLHVPPALVPPGYDVRRVGNVLYTKLDNVIVADAGYPGTGATVPGTSEVQTVTITGAPTGGTFTLTFDGQTTTPIAFNATDVMVAGALNALSSMDEPVAVTGDAGGPYTVTFSAAMGNVAQMTADASGLTGGTAPAVNVATTTPGVAPSVVAGTWVYATGPVQVRLSPIVTADDPAETVFREINRQEIWAERVFAATFDPCVHMSMNVTPAP